MLLQLAVLCILILVPFYFLARQVYFEHVLKESIDNGSRELLSALELRDYFLLGLKFLQHSLLLFKDL